MSGIKFNFEGISINSSGLDIADSNIILPSKLQEAEISLSDFKINADGSFALLEGAAETFDLFGTAVQLSNIKIEDGFLIFEGQLTFYKSTKLKKWTGKIMKIKKFFYNLDSGELVFEVNRGNLSLRFDSKGWKQFSSGGEITCMLMYVFIKRKIF